MPRGERGSRGNLRSCATTDRLKAVGCSYTYVTIVGLAHVLIRLTGSTWPRIFIVQRTTGGEITHDRGLRETMLMVLIATV